MQKFNLAINICYCFLIKKIITTITIMSQNDKCDCPKVPQPLPPNLSSRMRCAAYLRSFGTFVPYNRAKTGNLIGGKGRTNGKFPVKELPVDRIPCGK